MYDQIAVALLKEQINKEPESCLLKTESLSTIDNYIELVEKFQIEENIEKKGKIKTKILRLLGKDKTKNAFGGFTINEDLTDPTLLLISRKINYEDDLTDLSRAKDICEDLKTISLNLKLLIERTQQCLKTESFKADIKPIVLFKYERDGYGTHGFEKAECVVFIFNQHSFIRLSISPNKIKERIQRAIRKDIIDILLRDKQLIFTFHSIRDTIAINLNSYKEAKDLQEAIHSIRNSSMFPPRQNKY